jgi:hydrogenase expression/formation protein HypE
MLIKAVVFDFDGTLTEPGSLDFAAIREAIGCPSRQPILEHIESLPSKAQQEECLRILDQFEITAAQDSRPNAGAENLVRYLRNRKLKLGIVSRNSLGSIRRALENFPAISASDFDAIVSRDDFAIPKPSPDAVLALSKRFAVPAEEMLVVGDYIFDIEAGRRAGARTAFLTNRRLSPPDDYIPDFTIDQLPELKEIIDLHIALAPGKLPNDLLHRFLQELDLRHPSLIVAPGVGEDIACVRLDGKETLVLKSDPVTFATDSIGQYAVIVNVNDVATSGATPRWLLSTLLFPPGTTAFDVRQTMIELRETARRHGLLLCGGHTEISDAVIRPVIVAQVAGTVARERLIDKRNMKPGDRVILTKGIAIEGTCILAREFPDRLQEMGVSSSEIEKSRHFLVTPGISILKEAQIASQSGHVSAMHDVTEGGLATALEELSAAGNHRIRIFPDRIPIFDETRRICRSLDIHPLGLIASGSLLIACDSLYCDTLIHSLRDAEIDATCIGEVLDRGHGIEAVDDRDGSGVVWPRFETDEIARCFQKLNSCREQMPRRREDTKKH